MLHASLRRAATVAVALATLTACDAELLVPHADSTAEVSATIRALSASNAYHVDQTVPYSFGLCAACANGGQGDVLDATGQMHFVGEWNQSVDGQRPHTAFAASFTGTAIGWESGEEYDVTSRELYQSNTDYGADGIFDSGEQMTRIAARFTSRATGAVIDVTLVGRFVVTATGEWVLDGWTGTARCG